ncbi:helix-loop-helix DNA-binding domain containing protein [Rhodotorula toruloides]|uniref:Helix-loop-helix DNA-binding domain containing protein n=1 Tax=Rhodotorula toruloides TaxID=5286 RepID=A0A511KKV7_RHOTO|nr:helix-loop-helix DNA-binding domain containing protein [Rhodotorula toruloides]
MALLSDSEQRTIGQFLDSFDSTGQSSMPAHVPLPPHTNGHFATGGHYAGTGNGETGHGGTRNDRFAPPPPPVTLGRSSAPISIPSSSPALYPTLATHPLSHMPAYQPTGPSLSPETIASRPHRPQVTESQKRARMEQHKKDLEEWMSKAQPVGASEGQKSRATAEDGADAPSPPKRTRSNEEARRVAREQADGVVAVATGRAGEPDRMDPLVMMLEAERRAGFRNVGIAARGEEGDFGTSATTRRTGFAPPAPPPSSLSLPPPIPLPTATTASASPAQTPAPSAAAPTRRKKRAAAAVKPEVDEKPGSSTSHASSSSTTPGAPGAPSDDNPNPAPALTPANVPSHPLRPRPKVARPTASAAKARRAGSSTSPPPAKLSGGKPALLTAEQKKANHIASEQKRRAAIRAAYDGLCEVVPALSAAVAEFEERVRKVAEVAQGQGGRKGRGGAAGRGRGGESTTGALMGGISVGGEKIDGRAGPKSEAVVLSKTVEHLRALLTSRAAFLSQLSSLHAAAASQGISIPAPTADGYGCDWEQNWDDGMREELGFARDEEAVKREDEGAEDGEWEDDA